MKIIKYITNRVFLTVLLLLVQFIFILLLLNYLYAASTLLYWIIQAASVFAIILIFNKNTSPSIKLPWVVFIMVVPIVGLLFYILTKDTKMKKQYQANNQRLSEAFENAFKDDYELRENEDLLLHQKSAYIQKYTKLPRQSNTTFQYFSVGEEKFEQLLIDLKQAKQFIFMEYFIIADGYFWKTIKAILIEKAQMGVEVRLIYDDLGCLLTLPSTTKNELESYGIRVINYNPVIPIVSIKHNTRDHRKITVIDGHIGYTGGINIGDEYINRKQPLGHWKDTAIRLYGKGVLQLTLIFMQTWSFVTQERIEVTKYSPTANTSNSFASDGYVQAYLDSPMNDALIAQSHYMNILNQAKQYVYMYSPYFIVDNEMLFAICLAAKRGVDVVLILPHIPDKWYVHVEARSYYKRLLEAGVKVYEYTPGFMHAKSFICDDELVVIGTSNLDYRSLYHHLECGVTIYKSSIITEIKKDFMDTIAKSQIVTIQMYESFPLWQRFIGAILKFFSPLM